MSYDHMQLYIERIEPLLAQVHDICIEHRVPLLILAGVAGTDEGDHLRHSQCLEVPEVPTLMGLLAALVEDEELARMCMQLLAAKWAAQVVLAKGETKH